MIKTKESDSRATPKWLMGIFEDWFDPCPLNYNPTVDGLELDWGKKTYVNPPYSNPAPWVYKAIEESKKDKIIVLCMKFDPTTKYFRALIENDAHLFYSGERLRFTSETGIKYASPFPSILIVLNSPNKTSTDLEEEFKDDKRYDKKAIKSIKEWDKEMAINSEKEQETNNKEDLVGGWTKKPVPAPTSGTV